MERKYNPITRRSKAVYALSTRLLGQKWGERAWFWMEAVFDLDDNGPLMSRFSNREDGEVKTGYPIDGDTKDLSERGDDAPSEKSRSFVNSDDDVGFDTLKQMEEQNKKAVRGCLWTIGMAAVLGSVTLPLLMGNDREQSSDNQVPTQDPSLVQSATQKQTTEQKTDIPAVKQGGASLGKEARHTSVTQQKTQQGSSVSDPQSEGEFVYAGHRRTTSTASVDKQQSKSGTVKEYLAEHQMGSAGAQAKSNTQAGVRSDEVKDGSRPVVHLTREAISPVSDGRDHATSGMVRHDTSSIEIPESYDRPLPIIQPLSVSNAHINEEDIFEFKSKYDRLNLSKNLDVTILENIYSLMQRGDDLSSACQRFYKAFSEKSRFDLENQKRIGGDRTGFKLAVFGVDFRDENRATRIDKRDLDLVDNYVRLRLDNLQRNLHGLTDRATYRQTADHQTERVPSQAEDMIRTFGQMMLFTNLAAEVNAASEKDPEKLNLVYLNASNLLHRQMTTHGKDAYSGLMTVMPRIIGRDPETVDFSKGVPLTALHIYTRMAKNLKDKNRREQVAALDQFVTQERKKNLPLGYILGAVGIAYLGYKGIGHARRKAGR